ncbi:unnamed protein product [Lactuca saligna]|uniref:Calmodulin-binding domain-containing protein n=1 Tax=Lactuca saligna TaxID=75948 RepID=A0AA35YBH8_LACSI|nr:unnamed protein product [Lactuca saligna]
MATRVDENGVGGAPGGKPPRRYIISSTTRKTIIEEYRVNARYLKPSTGSCHDSCKNATDEWMDYKNTRNLGPKRIYAMTTSRYLTPSTGSCHDLCKHGKKDEKMELRTTRTLASRKRSVTKNNGVKRTVVSVERKKITEIKPKSSRAPKIRTPAVPVKVVKRHNSLPSKKVIKPISANHSSSTLKNKKVTKITPKKSHKPASPRKDQTVITKTQLRLMIADKMQEMILQEAEAAEMGVEEETIESPETLTTTESTVLQNSEEVLDEEQVENSESSSENCESSSNEQVENSESVDDEVCDEELLVEEEFEYDEEGYILEEEEDDEDDDDDDDGEKKARRYRVVRSEGKDGPRGVKFRRGKVLEVEGDDGPRRLKFKAGTVVESDEEEESEKVNLKHQEVGRKEAQELLNSVIEETASKLVEDMKTKVGALVGAFETVISRQDEAPATPSEK